MWGVIECRPFLRGTPQWYSRGEFFSPKGRKEGMVSMDFVGVQECGMHFPCIFRVASVLSGCMGTLFLH